MARARNVKPGLFHNEDLAELPMSDRLLFIGLWTLSDCVGILEDRVKRIKAQVFPYDDVDVDAGLNRLRDAGFLVRYAVNTHALIFLPTFTRHQSPHKNERASGFPRPGAVVGVAPEDSQSVRLQAPEQDPSAPSSRAPTESRSPPTDSPIRIAEPTAAVATEARAPADAGGGDPPPTGAPDLRQDRAVVSAGGRPASPTPTPDSAPPPVPPARDTEPLNPAIELVFAWCDATRTDPQSLGDREKRRQAAIGKRLADDGVTPSDVTALVGWLATQTWRQGGIDMLTIETNRARWVAAGKPSVTEPLIPPSRSRSRRPGYSPDELMAIARGDSP